MKIYVKGSVDKARVFAYQWAERVGKTLQKPIDKRWHSIHSLEARENVYFVTEKLENPDCDECDMILHGHKSEGNYIKLEISDEEEITIDDFIKNWKKLIDRDDVIVNRMKKQFVPKEIVGSYLYIEWN